MIFQGFYGIIKKNLIRKEGKILKFDKRLEHEYSFYLKEVSSSATKEDFKTYLRKSNPNALKDDLSQYLNSFFFDIICITVLEDKLTIQVKNRGDVELGLITSHYTDIPMLYSVSTQDAVKLLSHVWYSYKNGFDFARMTGYWEFPDKLEGSRLLHCDSPLPQIFSFLLRTDIDSLFVADTGCGKQVYLEKLRHLHEVTKSREYLWCSSYAEFPHTSWVSSLEVLPYTSESTINTQLCVRPFIEVEVVNCLES